MNTSEPQRAVIIGGAGIAAPAPPPTAMPASMPDRCTKEGMKVQVDAGRKRHFCSRKLAHGTFLVASSMAAETVQARSPASDIS